MIASMKATITGTKVQQNNKYTIPAPDLPR
jgi:hypothetical protein